MRDRLPRVRMRDFTALPPSSPPATATTNFLHHRLYPVIVAPTPALPSPSLSLSLSLFPPTSFATFYHDFSHRLFFLRTEMMTSGRGYLLRETRWCVERAIDEWEGRERGKRKKMMRYQWSKNKIKREAIHTCLCVCVNTNGNWYEREKEERFIANGGRSGSSECGHVLQRSKSTKIDEARSWLVWKRANDATTRRRGKTCTGAWGRRRRSRETSVGEVCRPIVSQASGRQAGKYLGLASSRVAP